MNKNFSMKSGYKAGWKQYEKNTVDTDLRKLLSKKKNALVIRNKQNYWKETIIIVATAHQLFSVAHLLIKCSTNLCRKAWKIA